MFLRSTCVVCWLVLAAACARELPSTRPLGTGPLAGFASDASAPAKSTANVAVEDGDDDETNDAGVATIAAAADAALGDAQALLTGDAGQKTEGSKAGTVVSFAGDFHGKDTNVTRLPGKPTSPPLEDPKARVTVSEERDKRLTFTLYGESGNVACSLRATTSGSTAQFSAGQDCIGGKLARGTARMDGDTLTLELVFELELEVEGQTVRATIEYRFEGRRKK